MNNSNEINNLVLVSKNNNNEMNELNSQGLGNIIFWMQIQYICSFVRKWEGWRRVASDECEGARAHFNISNKITIIIFEYALFTCVAAPVQHLYALKYVVVYFLHTLSGKDLEAGESTEATNPKTEELNLLKWSIVACLQNKLFCVDSKCLDGH